MNTFNTHEDLFSIEELESRFEMLAVPPPSGGVLHPDWTCSGSFQFSSK